MRRYFLTLCRKTTLYRLSFVSRVSCEAEVASWKPPLFHARVEFRLLAVVQRRCQLTTIFVTMSSVGVNSTSMPFSASMSLSVIVSTEVGRSGR